jgi:hypothetical protein
MSDQKPSKSNLYKKILVSITLVVDGVLFTWLGIIFLILGVMYVSQSADVDINFDNAQQEGQILQLANLVIFVLFLLAAIFWSRTKQVGKYLAAGLCIFFILALSIFVLLYAAWLLSFGIIVIPLFIFILAIIGLNIFAIRFVLSKGSPAIPDKENNTSPVV